MRRNHDRRGCRIVRRELSRKNQQAETHRMESNRDIQPTYGARVGPAFGLLVPASKGIVAAEQRGMIRPVNEVARFDAMPHTHQPKREPQPQVGSRVLSLEPLPLSRRQRFKAEPNELPGSPGF